MLARPIVTPLKRTGREMPMVSREILEGLRRVVFKGATINSLPPLPPLPDIVTSLNDAFPPNDPMPRENIND